MLIVVKSKLKIFDAFISTNIVRVEIYQGDTKFEFSEGKFVLWDTCERCMVSFSGTHGHTMLLFESMLNMSV